MNYFESFQKNLAVLTALAILGAGAVTYHNRDTAKAIPTDPDLSTSVASTNQGDNEVQPGQIITYTYQLVNSGGNDAVGAQALSTLDPSGIGQPTSFTFTNCGPVTNSSSGYSLDFSNLYITAGIDCIITFDVLVNDPYDGPGTVDAGFTASANGLNYGPFNAPTINVVEEPAPACGDENLDEGEQCDDGNLVNGDGCDDMCQIEVPVPICGDGNLDEGEQCDDGNLVNGDGCNDQCEVEQVACNSSMLVSINDFEANGPAVPADANLYLGNDLLGSGNASYEIALTDENNQYIMDDINFNALPKGSYFIQRLGNGEVKEGLVGGYDRPQEECKKCKGGLVEMTLQYNGDEAERVIIKQQSRNKVIFDQTVNPGEEFTIEGDHPKGKFGRHITILVAGDDDDDDDRDGRGRGKGHDRDHDDDDDDYKKTVIRTTCHRKTQVGNDYGDFTLVAAKSFKNGNMCGADESGDTSNDPVYVYMQVTVQGQNAELVAVGNFAADPFEKPYDGSGAGIDLPKHVIGNDEISINTETGTVGEHMSVWPASDLNIKKWNSNCVEPVAQIEDNGFFKVVNNTLTRLRLNDYIVL